MRKEKPIREYSNEKLSDKITKTEQTKYHLHSKYPGGREVIKIIRVKKDCGCCYDDIEVDSDFEYPEPNNGSIIYDINGIPHKGLDTFYGYEILSY